MRLLCVFALVIACSSCGDDRLRSARGGDSADRERVGETLSARLSRLTLSPAGPVPLRDVVASPALVGRRVQVVGRCSLHLRVPDRPAHSRETWQLEGDGVTVLVVGAPPSACTARHDSSLIVTAVVAEDTLAAIGDLPSAPRRYLVLVESNPR